MTPKHPAHVPSDRAIADEVRAAMARRHVTQTQLAEALGISRQAVSDRLRGRTPFTVRDLLVAARVLRVSPWHLIPQPAAAA